MIFSQNICQTNLNFDISLVNITELKKSFDILDEDGNKIKRMIEILRILEELEFSKTAPNTL